MRGGARGRRLAEPHRRDGADHDEHRRSRQQPHVGLVKKSIKKICAKHFLIFLHHHLDLGEKNQCLENFI